MKKLSIIAACALTVGLLGGCGNKLDAAAYTKALLDNSYKNDSTDFVSMKIGTEEEAADLYEQGLDGEVNAILSEFAAYGASVTDEQTEKFRQIMADILAGAKYTVGEVEKQDDTYVVTITYEQMQVFTPAYEAYMDGINKMGEEWEAAAAAGEATPSTDEAINLMIDLMTDSFADAVQSATYAEPQTTTFRIELVNNVYTPNQSDIVNLETVLFDIEAAANITQ